MTRLALYLFSFLLFSGCVAQRKAARSKEHVKKLTTAIWNQDPVSPDSLSGYLPNPEINLLDALQRKYPGRVKIVTRTVRDTIRLPGKTVRFALPVVHDTIENRVAVDSLLSELKRAAQSAQQNSELRAAYANLQVRLLQELNRRGCLPDTMVQVAGFGFHLTLHVIPRPDGNYDFELVKAEQKVPTTTAVTEEQHSRIVQTPALVFWKNPWFYAFVVTLIAGGSYGWWITRMRLEDAKPATSR